MVCLFPVVESSILILHLGGGYVLPASDAMVEFMFQVVDSLKSKGKNVACLFLSYGIRIPAPKYALSSLIS
jgi:hypothetical protein